MLTLTMFSVLTRCLGFLYKIYLSRIMTTTDLGIYNLSLSIYMVVITLVSSSIPLTISKITSANKVNQKEFNTNYSVTSSLILNLIFSILLTLGLIITKPLIIALLGSNLAFDILVTLLPSIIFTALYAQIRGYLWGQENYFAVSTVEFIEQILRIVFCIIFVWLNLFSSPTLAVGLALSIACGLSTLYGYILYFRTGGKLKFKAGHFKEIIKSSLPLTCVRICSSLMMPLVSIILPIILGQLGMERNIALSELGIIMGMSMPLLSIPSTIIGALCMILVPRISTFEDKKQENLSKQIDGYINFSLICIFMFIPIFLILGTPICAFVFDNQLSGLYLTNSTWIILPMGISQITSSILNALNQEKQSFYYYIISSIFIFLAVLILPTYIGILSMTYGIGISSIVLSILNIQKIKKITNYKNSIPLKSLVYIGISIPIILLTKITFNWINTLLNSFLAIGITCSIACIGYLAMLFIFDVLDFRLIKKFFTKTLKQI